MCPYIPKPWLGYEQRHLNDLNQATIENDEEPGPHYIRDRPHRRAPVKGGPRAQSVTVLFDNLMPRLCQLIAHYPVVVGCMAWLSSAPVLTALAAPLPNGLRRQVSIIVQKEDWLRPDSDDWNRNHLKNLYGALVGIDARWEFDLPYNTHGDPDFAPVRCLGIVSGGSRLPAAPPSSAPVGQSFIGAPVFPKSATPRMHHKFLVFGRMVAQRDSKGEIKRDRFDHIEDFEIPRFIPDVVWTGSYNATSNGSRSLENAVIIDDPQVAHAYTEEWRTLMGFSEPLDWNATWVASDQRIGT